MEVLWSIQVGRCLSRARPVRKRIPPPAPRNARSLPRQVKKPLPATSRSERGADPSIFWNWFARRPEPIGVVSDCCRRMARSRITLLTESAPKTQPSSDVLPGARGLSNSFSNIRYRLILPISRLRNLRYFRRQREPCPTCRRSYRSRAYHFLVKEIGGLAL